MATAPNKNYQLSFKRNSNGKISSSGQFDNRDPVQVRQHISSTYGVSHDRTPLHTCMQLQHIEKYNTFDM
eukprot:15320300-Ditylum_brightwellii.AAC.1